MVQMWAMVFLMLEVDSVKLYTKELYFIGVICVYVM